MAAAVEPKLKPRTLLPPFELTTTQGTRVNIWQYKARKNLALGFMPRDNCPECMEFLGTVAESYHRYETENTVFLCIMQGGLDDAEVAWRDLQPPYPVLYDPIGEVTARYTNAVPAVFVADKFGELYAQWISGPEGALPTQKEILDVIELINLECPE